MRVTNSMIADQVSLNTQMALRRFLEMQTQMSSGRRINKPSDDPLGVLRDLDYRTELAKNEQYQKNVNQGQNWIQTYDTALGEMKDMISTAKEVAVSMSNGTYDNIAREASAREIDSLFNQIIQLANSKHDGKNIFAGFKTDQNALNTYANGVRYNGDDGQLEFQLGSSTKMGVNLIGSDVFLKQLSVLGEKADLNVGINATTLLSNLHNGQGIDQAPGTITITDQNLGITSNIDLSGAVSINDVINTINAQLTADGITNLTVDVGPENNNLFFDTTQNGLISNLTSLNKINGGSGVDLSNGKIRLTDGGTIDTQVDFSSANTIGDIIGEFNTQVAAAGIANVTMQLNAAQTGLEITDTNGTPLGLSVSEIDSNTNVASALGILGNVNPTLNGHDLNPAVSFKVEEAGGTTAEDLGILADFSADYTGNDLDPILLTTSNISDLNNGKGFERGEIQISQGDMTRIIDLKNATLVTVQDLLDAINNSGLDITASINPNGKGIQIINNDPTKSLTIEDVSNGKTAKNMGIFGSSDMMGSLLVLSHALKNDDQEGTGMLIENLDNSIQHLLNNRASVGARGIRLESTKSRLTDQNLTYTQRLSEVEDADIPQLITDLSTYENNYKAALIASAKIIQPSLLDFMK